MMALNMETGQWFISEVWMRICYGQQQKIGGNKFEYPTHAHLIKTKRVVTKMSQGERNESSAERIHFPGQRSGRK
jgi:hypothetical protein